MALDCVTHFLILRRCILKYRVVKCLISTFYIQMVQKIYINRKNESKCGKIVTVENSRRADGYCTIILDLL